MGSLRVLLAAGDKLGLPGLTLCAVSTAVISRARSRSSPAMPVASRPPAPDGPVRRPRVAPLDGLRGVALVAVLAYHVAPSAAPGGFLGVESFFVLSGYLLAALLLDERARTGAIDGVAYARRRIRRLAPALVALLGALLVFVPLVAPDDAHRLAGDIASALAGVTNWHLIADQSSYFDRVGRPSFVRHVWSIAVEAQFYLLCPVLVTWVARRRRSVAVKGLLAGIAGSAVVMAVLYRSGDPSRAYYGTDARVGALLAGVLLAVVLDGRSAPARATAARRSRAALALGPPAFVVLLGLYALVDDRARATYPLAFLAAQLATALVIAAALQRGPLADLLASPRLRWLGRRSYGIYLWHWPVVVLLRPGIDVGWPPAVTAVVSTAIAVVLGALSYGLVERQVLASRGGSTAAHRRTVAVARLAALVCAGGLLGLFVHLPTTDPLAATLQAGQHVLASQPAPAPIVATPAPAPASTAAPPTVAEPTTVAPPTAPPTVAPLPAPPTTAPPPPVATAAPPVPALPAAVTAIGDSIMVSAAGALHARLGTNGYIDAHQNRRFPEAAGIVRRMREQGTLAPVVVVHLGNNGLMKPADLDALVQELPPTATLLLVNLRVHTSWEGDVNRLLAEAADRHPMVTLVDWHGESEGHRDWFQSDGTHFRTTSGPGANAYADLIARSVPPPPAPPVVNPVPPADLPATEPSSTVAPPTTALPFMLVPPAPAPPIP